jgi:hypothetical protein
MPADVNVVVKGYEDGVDDVIEVTLLQIRRDVHEEWYYGRHAIDETGTSEAVLIAGPERYPD